MSILSLVCVLTLQFGWEERSFWKSDTTGFYIALLPCKSSKIVSSFSVLLVLFPLLSTAPMFDFAIVAAAAAASVWIVRLRTPA